ncbi:MAG: hypothetical protein LUD72_05480, partial [Bacteroidales bacterium]|nr:hypothetical protein [Bacteroidales bacterium]
IRLQYDDFKEMNLSRVRNGDVLFTGRAPAMHVLYSEIFENKTENLFTNLVLLHDRKFFRIVDYDDSRRQFVARCVDDLTSNKKIEAYELYEKIAYVSTKKAGDSVKCLIVGDVPVFGRKILDVMLSEGKDRKYTIDYLDDRDEMQNLLTDCGMFLERIRLYDKVFVIDCPELYRNHTFMQVFDDASVLQNSSDGFSFLLSKKNERGGRDFDNRNGFVELYYRVQNRLLLPNSHNMVRVRFLNKKFLYFMNSYFACDEDGSLIRKELAGKELYVYFSGSEDFRNDRFDLLDIARAERHNSKEWRAVKFSARDPASFDSSEKKIETSFYDILKNVSVSGDFLCEMTGDRGGQVNVKKICKSVQIARRTSIEIKYDEITSSDSDENRMKIEFHVGYPVELERDAKRLERYEEIVSFVLKEAFGKQENADDRESATLIGEFRDSFVCAVYDAAKNYNDVLFWHIYSMPAKKGSTNVAFKIIGDVHFAPADPSMAFGYGEEQTGYSHKKTASRLIRNIESEAFSKADIMGQTNMVAQNGGKLDDYICDLRQACINLGYTYGDMYLRMQKYYF